MDRSDMLKVECHLMLVLVHRLRVLLAYGIKDHNKYQSEQQLICQYSTKVLSFEQALY